MSSSDLKIKLNLKRRASEISIPSASGGGGGESQQQSHQSGGGTGTPPEGGMTSSSSLVSLSTSAGPDGLPKVKKIKISIGGRPVEAQPAHSPLDSWGVLERHVIQEHALKLLKVLKDMKQSGRYLGDPFLELVPKNEYPDYYDMIKNPISFAEIEAKITSARYASMSDFKNDVMLCFANCKIYNQPNSGIYADATALENRFLDLYKAGPNGFGKKRARLSVAAPKTPSGAAVDTTPSSDSKKKGSTKQQKVPPGMMLPKPRPSDPFLLLFDCLERSDYKNFQDTFDSVITGPSVCNKLMPVNLFEQEFTWTILHAACYYGSLKAVEMLIERGANIEAEDTWYRGRPFAWATFGGHPKLCRVLMDKYKVDKEAKNIHGQTAYDLISDKNMPHWKALFAPDRKPMVFPSNPPPKPVPTRPINSNVRPINSNVPSALPTRRATYVNPVGVTPVTSSGRQSIAPNYLVPGGSRAPVTASGATLGKVYRRGTTLPQQQQADAKKMPTPQQPPAPPKVSSMPTEYQNYLDQRREVQEECALLTNLVLTTEDETFKLGIPLSPHDPEYGFTGAFVALPKGLTKINIHLELTPNPFPEPTSDGFKTLYTVSGHHGHSVSGRSPDGQFVHHQLSIPVVMSGDGDINETQDFEVKLGEGVNSVELAVTATSWGDAAEMVYGVHQTYCLMLGRQ